ncbi:MULTISPECIES: hypothetical protein [Bacillaceae]|uniref:hypothetical protein n=1 Tax=Bacillaceae TaxID=186817 RepID=UPI00118C7261|nr:hypothetical protein [Bacillus sp. S3]QCJ42112.1 hypothetical protein FAY30_09450 [Bacillus sp. S3]
MEPRQPGNKKLPDFNELNDRIIAESSPSPMLVIKTNLDPKEPMENNPYYQEGELKSPKAFRDYFED